VERIIDAFPNQHIDQKRGNMTRWIATKECKCTLLVGDGEVNQRGARNQSLEREGVTGPVGGWRWFFCCCCVPVTHQIKIIPLGTSAKRRRAKSMAALVDSQ
jgi:hypothetical protein